jgi:hypothetical protein
MRLAFYEDIDARDPLENKDSLSTNVFYEEGAEKTLYAIKRAGTSTYLARTGGAMGIFVYGDTLYSWTQTDNPLIPTETSL